MLAPLTKINLPSCHGFCFQLFSFTHWQRKADIRNPLSLLAHERSRFATYQWELLTPTDISIPPYPPLSALRT